CRWTLTRHLTSSDFSTPSTVCATPQSKLANDNLVWLCAATVQDVCGPKAERRRPLSSKPSATKCRRASTFCACIPRRTTKTIRRSTTSALSTPWFLPGRRDGGFDRTEREVPVSRAEEIQLRYAAIVE